MSNISFKGGKPMPAPNRCDAGKCQMLANMASDRANLRSGGLQSKLKKNNHSCMAAYLGGFSRSFGHSCRICSVIGGSNCA
jgi:hypothetical protein